MIFCSTFMAMGRLILAKHESEAAAQAVGEAVRKRMRSPERWTVRTWENQSWHWDLRCENVTLCESSGELLDGDRTFFALVSDDPDEAGGGLSAWTSNERGTFEEPQEAVDEAVRDVYRYVDKLIAARQAADRAIDTWWTVVQKIDKEGENTEVKVCHVEAPFYRDALGLVGKRMGGTSVTIFDGKLTDACHTARANEQRGEEQRRAKLRQRRAEQRQANDDSLLG